MHATHDRPRLRQGLAAARHPENPATIVVWDDRRLTHRPAHLSMMQFTCCELFDGRTHLNELRQYVALQSGGVTVALEEFAALVAKLDDALLLESPRFLEYLNGPIRDCSCFGHDFPVPALRSMLDEVFTGPGGPGPIAGTPPNHPAGGPLRALLVPHMDYRRGNVTYGWGFKELFEKTSARLFVIIATSHYSAQRYILSRQHFHTPLGVAETDLAYVDRIAKHYGDELYADRFAHLPEHSIELEVILLQYLYEQHRPFRIVPLLVGPFADAVRDQQSPRTRADVARMVTALQKAECEAGEPVCYIISGDLAHVGPKFSDPQPVGEPFLSHSKTQDDLIVRSAEAADPDGYFAPIAAEGDRRRICGLPPTWTTLAATRPSRGRLLHYGRFIHPEGFESVSFASMAFDK